ncbi:MAG: hypothetical protein JWM16_4773 [Verrucomicrobiales bacterium]|nr:hypothetical protein [Verrucomicrobiales bacterium]
MGRYILLQLVAVVAIAFQAGATTGNVAVADGKATQIPPPSISPEGGLFGTNVTVTISAATKEIRYTLDGSTPATNSPLYTTPIIVSNSVPVKARAFSAGLNPSEVAAENYSVLETNLTNFASTLPLIVLNTHGELIKPGTNIHITVHCINSGTNKLASILAAPDFDGIATVKQRGYTSLRYPKRSFSLETRDREGDPLHFPLLGFPPDSDWVLYAPYPDKTLIRDVLAYELSNRLGHYASRTRFVEVFVNETGGKLNLSNYAGVYVLEEKMKRSNDRIPVQKLSSHDNEEPNITGGYILKKDHLEEAETKTLTQAPTQSHPSPGWHGAYPTGPGSFPADPAAFPPPFVPAAFSNALSLVTNTVTITNTTAAATNVSGGVTNITAATTNLVGGKTNILAAATNLVGATTNITAAVTNIFPATAITAVHPGIVFITNAVPVTNVAVVTNIAVITNVVVATNVTVASHPVIVTNPVVAANAVSGTNAVATTNVVDPATAVVTTTISITTSTTYRTNMVVGTNIVFNTNVAILTNIVMATNQVVATNVTVASVPVIVTNHVTLTNTFLMGLPDPLVEQMASSGLGFVTGRTNCFFFVEPKAGKITSAQRAYITNYLNRFEQALYGAEFRNPTNGYAAYIDADSFIDYHLFVEATKNIDGFRFSTYFTKDRGGKLKLEPIWDWNLSMGLSKGKQGYMAERWYWPQLDDRQYSWYRRLFEDPDFSQRYVDRWFQWRTNVFATSNFMARVDALAAFLKEPAARNFQRWPILGVQAGPEYYYSTKTYEEEVLNLKSWMTNRLTWMTAQFVGPPVPSQPSGILTTNLNMALTAAAGQIYFTTDGTDPRSTGGAVSPTARPFQTPFAVTNSVTVVARTQKDNRWSAPVVVKLANPAAPGPRADATVGKKNPAVF